MQKAKENHKNALIDSDNYIIRTFTALTDTLFVWGIKEQSTGNRYTVIMLDGELLAIRKEEQSYIFESYGLGQ